MPFSLISNMHYLYISSFVGVTFVAVNLVVLINESIIKIDSGNYAPEFIHKIPKIEEIPRFFGVAVSSLEGIGPVMDIRRSMKNPNDA